MEVHKIYFNPSILLEPQIEVDPPPPKKSAQITKIIFIVLSYFSVIIPIFFAIWALCAKKKHTPTLIINLDLNGTICSLDTKTKTGKASGLTRAIRKVIRSTLASKISFWEKKDKPNTPDSESLSIMEYNCKSALKAIESTQFTNLWGYEKVKDFIQKTLKAFKQQKTIVFTSIFKGIDWLNRNDIKYKIRIRTFGCDYKKVAKIFNERYGECFLTRIYKMGENGRIISVRPLKKSCLDTRRDVDMDMETFESQEPDNCIVHDYYKKWWSTNKGYLYGKPFLVNTSKDRLPMFFDDIENAIKPVQYTKEGHEKVCSPWNVRQSRQLIAVDTIQAMMDEDYFIKKFKVAIEEHRQRLKEGDIV